MPIYYEFQDIKKLELPRRKVSAWIKEVALQYGKKVGELSYLFCSDEKILEINRQYLEHDYYTDIITFDYSEEDIISGDVFISVDTVKSNAEMYKENFDAELLRVIIHGVLHLCGQGDKTDEEQNLMTEKENRALDYWQKSGNMR